MTSRVTRFFRALFSPRLGTDGSAASSVSPPGHAPIGIETNATWAQPRPPHDDGPGRSERPHDAH